MLLRVRAGPALTVQRRQRLVVDSPIPWEPVTRASWGSFLLQALCIQDKGLVSFQVSGPRDQLSCVTTPAGRPPSSRRRTLRTLMKTGLQGGKVRGRRNQSRLPTRTCLGQAVSRDLTREQVRLSSEQARCQTVCRTVRGYSCKFSSAT